MAAPAEHRIVVTGTARRTVAPDRAEWTVAVVESEGDGQMAFDNAAARLNVVMEALRNAFGEDAQLATRGMSMQPRWEHGVEVGVEVVAAVAVNVPVGQAGEVARVAMGSGGGRIHGPHYFAADRDAVQEALIAEAVEAARRKAELAAGAAGRSVGRTLTITEGGAEGPGPAYGMSASGARVRAPDVEPEEQLVSATVTVTYELEG